MPIISDEEYLARRTPEQRREVSRHVLQSVLEREAYRRLCGLCEPETVLDVGCGGGEMLEALERWRPGIAYTGIERFAEQLAVAVERRPEGQFRQVRDYFRLPERFDTVVLRSLLRWYSDTEAALIIGEARRVAERCVIVGLQPGRTVAGFGGPKATEGDLVLTWEDRP